MIWSERSTRRLAYSFEKAAETGLSVRQPEKENRPEMGWWSNDGVRYNSEKGQWESQWRRIEESELDPGRGAEQPW
jgi:hypothetical protein